MAGPFGTLLPFNPAALAQQERPDLSPRAVDPNQALRDEIYRRAYGSAPVAPVDGQQSLTTYHPTMRDKLATAVLGDRPNPAAIEMTQRLLGSAGAGNSGFSAVDLTPAGIPMAAQEAARQGDAQGVALAIIAGPAARTADLAALKVAQKMAKEGATREAIHADTGWFQGVDGKWRFEIDDSGARMNPDRFKPEVPHEKDSYPKKPLSKQLEHDLAYEAYPEIGKLKANFGVAGGPEPTWASMIGDRNGTGWFNPGSKFSKSMIGVDAHDVASARSIGLHELQHAIQQREGFASGASEADRNYRRIAGEVEARNVQERANMTAEERRKVAPWITEDVPAQKQIVRFGDNEASAARSNYPREIRPAGENLRDLIDANFNHATVAGDKMVPIGFLKGGVGQAADDAARVKSLREKIEGPDGYIERLVVDDAGNVIEGQHRLDALRDMGEKKVPVTVVKDLTRGFDYDKARGVLETSTLHSDQKHQLLSHVFDVLHKEKGKISAAREYDVPGFNTEYKKVLDELERQKKIGGKLPMDEASRMARAKELGYDTETTMYHGSPTMREGVNFDLDHPARTDTGYLGKGVYMTPSKWVADVYAAPMTRGGARGQTVDLYAKHGNYKDILYDHNFEKNINDFAQSIGVKTPFVEGRNEQAQQFSKEFREAMQKAGYDGARGVNPDGTVAEMVVYDPSRIRSTKAAFNPKKDGKNEIMGALAGFGSLMPLLQGREER